MNYMQSFLSKYHAIAVLIFCFLTLQTEGNVLRVNLKQAMDNHMVNIKATATSQGYHSKGLKLDIENKTGSDLRITMDAGIIFRPMDTSMQDLVLAGEEMLAIAPFKSGSTDVQTFCAKAHGGAPSAHPRACTRPP